MRGIKKFITMVALFEHVNDYRKVIKQEIISQLADLPPAERERIGTPPEPKPKPKKVGNMS
jgi:hypothetical protein